MSARLHHGDVLVKDTRWGEVRMRVVVVEYDDDGALVRLSVDAGTGLVTWRSTFPRPFEYDRVVSRGTEVSS